MRTARVRRRRQKDAIPSGAKRAKDAGLLAKATFTAEGAVTNYLIYGSRHFLVGRRRATKVEVNLVSLVLAPGIGIAGCLLGGWIGALTAEGLWVAAVLAGTLIHWLPHPEGRLRAIHLKRQCDRNEWLDRFSVRLQELQPSMSFPLAAKLAVRTWLEAADLEPEKAAEIYVNE